MARGILITGGRGQLGIELIRRSWPDRFTPIALSRDELDLYDTMAIGRVVGGGYEGEPWAAVINCAAYTAVDKAESEQVQAWASNALAPAAFGEACAKTGTPMVQVSTDYVFSGKKLGLWEVDDPTHPSNTYGASKLGGELAVRASGARHAILRTAWVVSAHGNNFVKTMLRLAQDRASLGVVDDQIGSPTSAADLSAAIQAVALDLAGNEGAHSGTYHFSNAGKTSWAKFAAEIFRQSALRGGPSATVQPIATADYPTPASRPANSLLSHVAIEAAFGIRPRPWCEALGDILDELIGEQK